MSRITVLLADDHTVVRQGLRTLLSAEPDLEVVAEAENGRQAVELAGRFRPRVVIMDIAMPVLNGLEATRQITRSLPCTKVLMLSSYANDEYIAALGQTGAAGYLLKHTAASELLRAIREACRGNSAACFSPAIAKRLRDTVFKPASGAGCQKGARKLTAREAEVLQLIAEGHANKQIAAELNISIKTVEKHRQQVMNKLGIHHVAGLTRHAIATGMVEPATGALQNIAV